MRFPFVILKRTDYEQLKKDLVTLYEELEHKEQLIEQCRINKGKK